MLKIATPLQPWTEADEAALLTAAPVKKGRGGARAGAGRKKGSGTNPDPITAIHGALSQSDQDYLALWQPNTNTTEQIRALIERARIFWPAGPQSCRAHSAELRRSRWEDLADELGIEGEARDRFLARNCK